LTVSGLLERRELAVGGRTPLGDFGSMLDLLPAGEFVHDVPKEPLE